MLCDSVSFATVYEVSFRIVFASLAPSEHWELRRRRAEVVRNCWMSWRTGLDEFVVDDELELYVYLRWNRGVSELEVTSWCSWLISELESIERGFILTCGEDEVESSLSSFLFVFFVFFLRDHGKRWKTRSSTSFRNLGSELKLHKNIFSWEKKLYLCKQNIPCYKKFLSMTKRIPRCNDIVLIIKLM